MIRLNGLSTEGIFRVPADLDEVNSVKCRFDQWEVVTCNDCHTAASLLKLWLRELYEPLVPDDFYEESITLSTRLETLGGKDSTVEHETTLQKLLLMVRRLPDLNRLVLTYLINFLQLFARPGKNKNCGRPVSLAATSIYYLLLSYKNDLLTHVEL